MSVNVFWRIIALTFVPFVLRAQGVQPTVTAPRTLAAIVARPAPSIDGRLVDGAWSGSDVARDFRQVEPVDGAPAAFTTEVRVALSGDALFVSARMLDPDPSQIAARLGRRDTPTNSDLFTLTIDSYHDHRTAFRFSVNAAGVRSDDVTSNDSQEGDDSWDPVWDAATVIDSAGWTVEMQIPLSQLRFASGGDSEWGINFERFVQRTGERSRWQWVSNAETGFASHFGHLAGVGDVAASRKLEIVPYVVAQGDRDSAIDPADPFRGGTVGETQLGADFKLGITSGLTMTGTLNPDFGQVEADPAEVNLTVFETFLQERRPFFVEGANLFRFGAGSSGAIFGAPQLFYSRRIGRPPSGGVPADAIYDDTP